MNRVPRPGFAWAGSTKRRLVPGRKRGADYSQGVTLRHIRFETNCSDDQEISLKRFFDFIQGQDSRVFGKWGNCEGCAFEMKRDHSDSDQKHNGP
jgi:hypothetical protein